jgi:hypothetical protein
LIVCKFQTPFKFHYVMRITFFSTLVGLIYL